MPQAHPFTFPVRCGRLFSLSVGSLPALPCRASLPWLQIRGADDHRSYEDEQGQRPRILSVLGFGGFLGLGNDHYPLPWQSLKYDTRLGGYRAGIAESQLRGASKYREDTDWNWSDVGTTRALNDYYGVPVM